MLSVMSLCCVALGWGILGWPLLVLCLCCRFCWCPSFRRLHNDVFLVAVFVLVFCFVAVVCLVWCVACLVVVFASFLPVSVLWVMPCVVLCRYLRFVFACRRFLRWVSAFGGCTMSSFTCMSVLCV